MTNKEKIKQYWDNVKRFLDINDRGADFMRMEILT